MDKIGWQHFITLALMTKEKQLLNELFDLFLTSEEKESLALRCLIIMDLLAGQKTQRQLAKDRGVSIAKITRGSNVLKTISPELKKHLEKILVEK